MNKSDLRFVFGMSLLLTGIAGCILWLQIATSLAIVLLMAGLLGIVECTREWHKLKRDDHDAVLMRLYQEAREASRCPYCGSLSWDGYECYSCHHEEELALDRAFERR